MRFQGAYGSTYFKLFQPFMSYKDELEIRTNHKTHQLHTDKELFGEVMKRLELKVKATYTTEEFDSLKEKIENLIDKK